MGEGLSMSIHVALLRAVNVVGHNKVAMSDLRGLLVDLGFADVKSVLQSGNLVFTSDGLTGAPLERLLEKETAKCLNVTVDYVVRGADEWRKNIARNPFPKEAKSDPSHLLVMFLKSAPSVRDVEALQSAIKGPEVMRREGKQLFITYPEGIGRSKLTGNLIERKLGVRGTARNWNTVLRLAALCE